MDHFQSFVNKNLHQANQITADQTKSELRKLNKQSRRSWSEDEDDQLKQAIELHGNNWLIIASVLSNRNPSQCAQRWKRIKPKNVFSKRQSWTIYEDNLLIKLVEQYKKNWVQIAKMIPNRTSKQVRERFVNNLNPNINQAPFTEAEDNLIIEGFKKFGSKWCTISKMLQGRPENVIKNRFYSYLRKQYLKIENPYYVVPEKNQVNSFSSNLEQDHFKIKKKKVFKKLSSLLENENKQNGKQQFPNENKKISKKSYKKVEKKIKQESQNEIIEKESLNNSQIFIKKEEQQENSYSQVKQNIENFEQIPFNFYSNTPLQPYNMMNCYSPQIGIPCIPSYIMTNPIMLYGISSQEILLKRSRDISKQDSY